MDGVWWLVALGQGKLMGGNFGGLGRKGWAWGWRLRVLTNYEG